MQFTREYVIIDKIMKHTARTTLYLLAFATVFTVSGVCFSRAVAVADESKEVNRTLLAPNTYEEYLPLNAPSSVAVCEDYKAIADGDTIYLYDVDNGVYSAYTHNVFVDSPTKNNVTKLQFDKLQNLYFLDASTNLYRLNQSDFSNFSSATVVDTDFVCSTFVIEDETLYYTNVSGTAQISKAPLNSLDKFSAVLLQDDVSSNPTLAFWDGELYFTDAGKYVHKINPESSEGKAPTPIAMFSIELTSISVNAGTFACTDIDGNFFAYDLSALTASKNPNEIPTLCKAEDGYSALSPFGEYVYAVQDNAIKRYQISEYVFDEEYAVCDLSNAYNRLNGATTSIFVDGKLYTADNGNARITIYDTAKDIYEQPISTQIAPIALASDNQTLLVASNTQLSLYSLNESMYGEELFTYTNLDELTGVTHVYGKYYCATNNNRFFTVEQTLSAESEERIWTIRNDTTKTYTRHTESLVSDAYGYLYTLYGSSVYRYTETEFLDHSNQTGLKIIDNLPANTKQIAVDYQRNVYAITDAKLYVSCRDSVTDTYATATEITLKTGDVYTGNHTPILTSFCFGIEDNLTYLVYDGNYIICTDELALPTVKNIPVDNADKQIFSEGTAEFTLLKTSPHALFVEFDIKNVTDAQTFPYLSYKREDNEYTVLKIGSVSDYHLVALFNTETHRYHTYLVLKTSCQTLDVNEYQTVYPEAERKNAWLSNNVALYKFPYLNPLLTVSHLPRGGKVVLLGEIGGLDHEYYQVSYTENGETKTGFIPKSYALFYDPSAEKSQQTEIGKTESDTDAIWRFAYILLGIGAICILIDFLILRKREDEE